METEKTLLHAVLVYLEENEQVLLPTKVRKIGAGCRNGYGGGKEEGQTSIEAVVEETKDESGGKNNPDDPTRGITIDPQSLQKVALLICHNTKSDNTTFVCEVEVYRATKWEGVAEDTDEMRDAQWFSVHDLPIEDLMLADKVWLPRMYSTDKKLIVTAHYGPFQKTLTSLDIQEVDELP